MFGKDCCVSGNFLCVLEKIVVFPNRLLCSRKYCCVLKKIVVFSKRLLCSSKDCFVSEQKLSCVLPLWATVPSTTRVTKHRGNNRIGDHVTRTRPRFRSVSASGLVTSTLKFCCVSLKFVAF